MLRKQSLKEGLTGLKNVLDIEKEGKERVMMTDISIVVD